MSEHYCSHKPSCCPQLSQAREEIGRLLKIRSVGEYQKNLDEIEALRLSLHQMDEINANLEAKLSKLVILLTDAAKSVCSLDCPSTKKTGEPWAHTLKCRDIQAALREENPNG